MCWRKAKNLTQPRTILLDIDAFQLVHPLLWANKGGAVHHSGIWVPLHFVMELEVGGEQWTEVRGSYDMPGVVPLLVEYNYNTTPLPPPHPRQQTPPKKKRRTYSSPLQPHNSLTIKAYYVVVCLRWTHNEQYDGRKWWNWRGGPTDKPVTGKQIAGLKGHFSWRRGRRRIRITNSIE